MNSPDTPAHSEYEPVRISFSEAQLLTLASAHRWLDGYFEGVGREMPYGVRRAIWDFMPPNMRFACDNPDKQP